MVRNAGSIRVVFWNTWLLRPRLWSSGPGLPGSDHIFAPDVTRRAPLIGQALAGRFDVCALSEVFGSKEQAAVAGAWDEAEFQPGPKGTGRMRPMGSGLVTIVDPTNVEVVATADHIYRTGGDLRDSDSFANKGALLTRVRLDDGGPEIDVVSTHLLAGGEWLPLPGANDHARHHRTRLGQVDELIDFIAREHDPHIPLLVVGDLNIAAHDVRAQGSPDDSYRDLVERFEPLGLVDLWATEGVGPGTTSGFTKAGEIPPDPALPDAVLDSDEVEPTYAPGSRIDYLWLAVPDGGKITVEADRPRRWAYPGRDVRGGPAGSLSDHLAISTTLHLRRSR